MKKRSKIWQMLYSMSIDDLIQMGLLVIAILSVLCTLWIDRKQRRFQLYAEYTRRYHDFFMNIPEGIYNGTADMDSNTKRYMRLYFDLCNEEYHLWKSGQVNNSVWQLWLEGMQIAMQHTIYRKAWKTLSSEYNLPFRKYFEHNMLESNPYIEQNTTQEQEQTKE